MCVVIHVVSLIPVSRCIGGIQEPRRVRAKVDQAVLAAERVLDIVMAVGKGLPPAEVMLAWRSDRDEPLARAFIESAELTLRSQRGE
jgi:hypothetical protein